MDVVPRAAKIDTKGGVTILAAANSIQSMIFKRLLDRRSDLLAMSEVASNAK
jgi:hypothetical protein